MDDLFAFAPGFLEMDKVSLPRKGQGTQPAAARFSPGPMSPAAQRPECLRAFLLPPPPPASEPVSRAEVDAVKSWNRSLDYCRAGRGQRFVSFNIKQALNFSNLLTGLCLLGFKLIGRVGQSLTFRAFSTSHFSFIVVPVPYVPEIMKVISDKIAAFSFSVARLSALADLGEPVAPTP